MAPSLGTTGRNVNHHSAQILPKSLAVPRVTAPRAALADQVSM